MRFLYRNLPVVMLLVISVSVPAFFNEYMIAGGLNPKDASLITVLAVFCYMLGLIASAVSAKLSGMKVSEGNGKKEM